jgi:hypothetical protein
MIFAINCNHYGWLIFVIYWDNDFLEKYIIFSLNLKAYEITTVPIFSFN